MPRLPAGLTACEKHHGTPSFLPSPSALWAGSRSERFPIFVTDTVADTPEHYPIRYDFPQFATIAKTGRPLGLPGSVEHTDTVRGSHAVRCAGKNIKSNILKNISLVEFNLVFPQHIQIFLPKRPFGMMCFLIHNVLDNARHMALGI